MSKLGLTVNDKKTRLVKLPDERFDFLGYTVGWFYGYRGRPYWGTAPSKKSIKRLKKRTAHAIELCQFNPDINFQVPLDRVVTDGHGRLAIHKVLSARF